MWQCAHCRRKVKSLDAHDCAPRRRAKAEYERHQGLEKEKPHGKSCSCVPLGAEGVKCRWCKCTVAELQWHLERQCWQYEAHQSIEAEGGHFYMNGTLLLFVGVIGLLAFSCVRWTLQ
jgi:hypothetical protein